MTRKTAGSTALVIISLILFYIGNRVSATFTGIEGNILVKFSKTFDSVVGVILNKPIYLSLEISALIAGLLLGMLPLLIYLYNFVGRTNFMPGSEHGSARWGKSKDSNPFKDTTPTENIILTKTESLSMSDRMKRNEKDDFNRNKNVLVVGGAGSGKTRYFIKPNIMQMHSSYVITDPKGSLFHETGAMLQEAGYKIRVFDLIDRENSDKYNPFNYLMSEDDILKLINNLITNTNNETNKNAGDFWEKSETALLQAIFGYLFYEANFEDQNMNTVMDMINIAGAREDSEDHRSALDVVFEELAEINPNHFAVRSYNLFKLASGKTAKSILVSVGVRLSKFTVENIKNMVSEDTLELDKLGSEKRALFVIIPDSDTSFNFLASMVFQQMFDTLIYQADKVNKGKLKVPVRCLMDEFSNIGKIPMFDVLISTIRSRGISASIVLQNLAQIKSKYKDTWEIITGNCDSFLFLGGTELSTLEYVSKVCGKTTIDNRNVNETKGQSGSISINSQIIQRDLITPDEVGGLPGTKCILKIRGAYPFNSPKYDIKEHIRYQELCEDGYKNWFDLKDRIDPPNNEDENIAVVKNTMPE